MAPPFTTEPNRSSGISGKVLLAATAAVLLLVIIIAVATLRRAPANPSADLPPDTYASQLALYGISLFEATNGPGCKVTYLDANVRNIGSRTLTAATVQVTFNTNNGSTP